MGHATKKLTPQELKLTYEDYLLLPDDRKRYEIIEGELYMTPAPIPKHQKFLFALSKRVDEYVSRMRLGTILIAPCDVVLSKHDVVQPDIIFVSKENQSIITEKNLKGTPDLLVEITSPNTKKQDLFLKKKLYAKTGVKEYWIVFLKEQKVEVWRLENQAFILDGEFNKADILRSPLLQGLEIPLNEVFQEIDEYFKY